MILANITSSLLAPLLALSSFAGFTGDSLKTAIPRAQAQVAQSMNIDHNWNGWNDWRGAKPVITEIDPEEGQIGTEVTLTGKNFNDDSIVRFGKGAIHDATVSDDGTSLSFVIPEDMGRYCPPWQFCTQIAFDVTPGAYDVRVQNGNRTSNAVSFEVTDNDGSDAPLAIEGVSGPATLSAGEEGTWSVDVTSESDDLQYSVKWGDENWMPLRLFGAAEKTQSSATFTHTYDADGTYHPEFKVTDSEGNEVSTSTTVIVGDEENDVPHITQLAPLSLKAGGSVTITGTGFDEDSVVHIGSATGTDVDVVSDTEITFTVPKGLAPATYDVSVTDNDGTSNAADLTVLAATKVSVNGLDAPARLEVNEEGTWTVHAASNASGNLRYSVDWGEGIMARLMASDSVTQSSATFTHSYDQEGTYHPTFTVTDENGQKASVSASVIVKNAD